MLIPRFAWLVCICSNFCFQMISCVKLMTWVCFMLKNLFNAALMNVSTHLVNTLLLLLLYAYCNRIPSELRSNCTRHCHSQVQTACLCHIQLWHFHFMWVCNWASLYLKPQGLCSFHCVSWKLHLSWFPPAELPMRYFGGTGLSFGPPGTVGENVTTPHIFTPPINQL